MRSSVPTRRRPPLLSSPVVQFAASGLAALVLVAVGGVLVLRHQGRSESVRNARTVTELLATTAVEPRLEDGLLRGDPSSVARLDRVVRSRVLSDPFVRVKLWTPGGRIVYSDEPRLIGSTYALAADDLDALRRGRVAAELSDLSRPENRFERRFGDLLEVYLPVRTHSGRPLLFEAYVRNSSVLASGRRIWGAFLPALLAALVLLWLVQLPLAASLMRRLRARQRERETLLVQAIDASNVERRRIASDLHDGAVQDLAGISFSLAAAAGDAERAERPRLREVLEQGARVTRETMRQLRSLLVEIYPPNLHDAGLEAALADLLAPLRRRGVAAVLELDDVAPLSPEVEQLVFRTAQEAVRNVADHAAASRVDVTLRRLDGRVVFTVADDGRGFDSAVAAARRREGHFGLALLVDRAADLGGHLDVESTPGRGTSVRLEVGA